MTFANLVKCINFTNRNTEHFVLEAEKHFYHAQTWPACDIGIMSWPYCMYILPLTHQTSIRIDSGQLK